MGLSPISSKKAQKALEKIAPDFPIVFANSRQMDSVNKMQDVIVVLDKSAYGTESIVLKTLKPERFAEKFNKIKGIICNTSMCYKVPKERDLIEGVWHIGWS